MEWVEFKSELLAITGLTDELAHVYGALLIQLFIAWTLRRSLGSVIPLAVVLALQLVNEWLDMRSLGGWDAMKERHWVEAGWDVVHTMAIPFVLFALSRWAPRLLTRGDTHVADDEPGESAQIE